MLPPTVFIGGISIVGSTESVSAAVFSVKKRLFSIKTEEQPREIGEVSKRKGV